MHVLFASYGPTCYVSPCMWCLQVDAPLSVVYHHACVVCKLMLHYLLCITMHVVFASWCSIMCYISPCMWCLQVKQSLFAKLMLHGGGMQYMWLYVAGPDMVDEGLAAPKQKIRLDRCTHKKCNGGLSLVRFLNVILMAKHRRSEATWGWPVSIIPVERSCPHSRQTIIYTSGGTRLCPGDA